MTKSTTDIRQASPREQARWLRDRGWKRIYGVWHYGYGVTTHTVNAVIAELAAEALRRKRARKGVK